MALTFGWSGYNTGDTSWSLTIGSTNILVFNGDDGYGSPIWVGEYNDSMHIRLGSSAGDDVDSCSPNHLSNIKYIDGSNVSIRGGAAAPLTSVVSTDLLKVVVSSDTNFVVLAARMYGFDGVSVTQPPPNVNIQCFELGNNSWTLANGRNSALNLAAQANSALSHEFYVGSSVGPTSTGSALEFAVRLEIDIQ